MGGMTAYDKWLIPKDPVVVGKCDVCMGDIYEHQDVLIDQDNYVVYCDEDCFKKDIIDNLDYLLDDFKEFFNVEIERA